MSWEKLADALYEKNSKNILPQYIDKNELTDINSF
jgi:hypothetical protein